MVVTAGKDKAILGKRNEIDFGMGSADEVDAEIGLAARHGLQAFIGADIQDADADAGIGGTEPADGTRQEVENSGRYRGDRHQSAAPRPQIADAEDRRFKLIQKAPDLRD